jgi:hypothetical protein
MILLHNIGQKPAGPAAGNYNSVEQISEFLDRNPTAPLSFDGVYLNVWENRKLIDMFCYSAPILFVMGNVIGGNNSFDRPMPPEKYCDWWHLMDLVTNYDCLLGWHTWSHHNLCELSDKEVLYEVTPPFPMKYFAYPYGDVNERVEKIVRSVGCYVDAYSVVQGHGGPFQRKREYL